MAVSPATAVATVAKKAVPTIYEKILSKFPKDHFTFCFAYGSGVFKQSGKPVGKPMLDFIFVVKNSVDFHQENLIQNPSHYSVMKYLGHTLVANLQDSFGAKVYFNTLVPIEDESVVIKYGVISSSNLITDLLDWSELYIAGRLHKPVRIVQPTNDPTLEAALNQNLLSAMHTALLLLPDVFTEKELYKTITNLSYSGDFRTLIGEDKNKVNNIVEPQVEYFRELYSPVLKTLREFVEVQDENSSRFCRQDTSPVARLYHLNQLPRTPQRSIVRFWNKEAGGQRQDTEDVLRAISFDTDVDGIVENCIKDIVWTSSLTQSVKGLLTAGLFKSVKYSSRKIVKMISSTK